MDDEKLTKIFNYESEIEDDGSIKIPKEDIKLLKQKGYNKLHVVLFGSALDAADDQGIDMISFGKIRDLQTLPETVVLDFLKMKGKLNNTNFSERVKY